MPNAKTERRPATLSTWALIAGAALAAPAAPSLAQNTTQANPTPAERLEAASADVRALIGHARDRVFPSLVNIDAVSLTYSGGKETKGRSTGSGTIISADGYVLTNAHVTDDGYRFWVTLSDKRRAPATLVGEDPWTDLAVLKIDVSRLGNASLPAAEFGDSDELRVGDYVLAMGSPFSLSRTVTLGVVSNTERVFTSLSDGGEVDEMMLNWEQRTGLFTNWIQHDALINPGNSGGPLVTLAGEIIGINTRGGAGMAFATPSNLARRVAEELIKQGEVLRSSVGASFRHLERTGLTEGVLVDSVDTEGPAYAAGLRPGDVIKTLNGEPITVRFTEEIPPLLKKLAELPIGATVTIGYERAGEPMEASFATEKLLRDEGEEAALRNWGITAQRITRRMAQQRRLDSTEGALVSSLRSGGPATTAEPSLTWGDVIRKVDGQPTPNLKSLVEAYTRIDEMEKKPEWVLIEFERDGKSYVTLIKPKPEDPRDPPRELPKAWIGVATQPLIKNLAEKLGHPDRRGFRVMRVYTGTEAERAGLRVGDVILAINGEKLEPKGLQDAGLLNRAVRRMDIGAPATLAVLRDGQTVELPVTLERTRIGPEEAQRARSNEFELSVREITFFDRQDRNWSDDLAGVYVDSAEGAGWAGLAGIRSGDVIQKIDGKDIPDVAAFKAVMKKITEDQPERVVFVVFRGSRTFFRFVEPDWKPVTVEKPGQTAADTPEDEGVLRETGAGAKAKPGS